MKKNCILFLIIGLSFSINCNSQVAFNKGYYINNLNQKINCLIEDEDWYNNPTEFKYKISKQTETETLSIDSIKEFGINNASKYIRFNVNIDRSSYDRISLLDYDKNPTFKKEKLFLKVLIEGEASLFIYRDKNITRYFYKTNEHDIEQLIFKKYKIQGDEEEIVAENNNFRRQLYHNLKCSDIAMNDFLRIDYKKNDLLKFFINYNNCSNSEFVNFDKKTKRDLFNIKIRLGLNNSSFAITKDPYEKSLRYKIPDYGNKLALRIGMELEFFMNFHKKKWALIIEPTYQYYKSEVPTPETPDRESAYVDFGPGDRRIDYKSIELPVGIRRYIFLNKKSNFFINSSLVFDIPLTSIVIRKLEYGQNLNLAVGLGYNYNNKYSVEFRYHTNRNLLKNYQSYNSDYKTASIIFGYTIF